jgi:S1-C subfamily serine protease
VNAAQAAMVRISSGGASWSGVLIDSAGLILSTARDLGNAPVVSFTIEGGASGNAWVLGRDGARDIAIFEILEPQAPYPSINISAAEAPSVGAEMAVLSYPAGRGGSLERLNTRIIGVRQDFNTGAFYLQIQTQAQAGTQGGALVDTSGEVRGLRMREEQMIALGFGQIGEVYMMASTALLENTPRLRNGYLQISAAGNSGLPQDSSAPPGLPVLYHGTVSIGGTVVTDQPRVYLKLSKPGLSDMWFSTPVDENGNYVIAVQASSSYGAGAIEFWALAQKAN